MEYNQQSVYEKFCSVCGHSKNDHAALRQGRSYLFCEHPNCECVDFQETPIDKFISNLISYGFKEFQVNERDTHNKNWQYKLKDAKGIKLFVQVRYWNFSKYSTADNIVYDSFDAWCQYNIHRKEGDNNLLFNVDIHSIEHMSAKEIVDWFDNMFNVMNCCYYEEWQEN